MANRLVGNVYIIDSSGVPLDWLSGAKIAAIGFFTTSTAGTFELSYASDTTNSILRFDSIIHTVAPGSGSALDRAYQSVYLGGVSFPDALFVRRCNVGTGWIYFL